MSQPKPTPTSTPATALTPVPTRPATGQPRVAVVGGSLSGPVAALLFLHAGFDDVTVYEAVPDSAPQGGGLIGLEHSSLDILDRLDVAQPEFVKYDSEAVMHITVRDRRPGQPDRTVYAGRNTTWTLLHTALTRRLPAGVLRSGKRVTALAEQHRRPVLQFADGDTEPADLVVFADGRSSIGRRLLDPDRRLRYAGYVAHRGQAATSHPGLYDFLRFEPSPAQGVQFNIPRSPAARTGPSTRAPRPPSTQTPSARRPPGGSSPCRSTSPRRPASRWTRTRSGTCPTSRPPSCTPPRPGWPPR